MLYLLLEMSDRPAVGGVRTPHSGARPNRGRRAGAGSRAHVRTVFLALRAAQEGIFRVGLTFAGSRGRPPRYHHGLGPGTGQLCLAGGTT